MMIFQHRDTERQRPVKGCLLRTHPCVVVLFFILLMTPIVGMAQVTEINGIYYKLDNSAKTAEVTYKNFIGNDYAGDVVIPSTVTYGGVSYSVTSIGSNAFFKCSGMTSINIPNSVTSISIYAFSGCFGLTSIMVDTINPKYDSRKNCNAIIETASNTLISGCKNTIIPNSVTSIGDNAFYGCSSLTSIEIPNSVTSIEKAAFMYCTSLTSVRIPNSVTSIGYNAFCGCSSLASVDIPNSVTSIGKAAFYGCSSLTSVDIPNSVTRIGEATFYSCSSLTSVGIPNSVTSIEGYAFNDCSSLTSVTIPNSVTSIEDGAFQNCSSLTSVTIPNSVTNIGIYAFSGCSGLTSIMVDTINPKYDSRKNCNAIIETASNTLLSGCMNTTIPNSVTSIGEFAFYGCSGLTSITIPNSVTSIGNGAFEECFGLTSIAIPNSVTSIGDYAFCWCDELTSVTVENPIPVAIDEDTFTNRSKATLYVPTGSKTAYQTADYWREFKEINETETASGDILGDVNNDGEVNIADAMCIFSWLLENKPSVFVESVADFNQDGTITVSDGVAIIASILDNSQSYLSCPDNHHPHMIDLGLPSGTKWACCNVGASAPEGYGGYYAWGETEEKDVYSEETYKYYQNGSYVDLGTDIAGTQYDVAHVIWGGSWVMPSSDQQVELRENCTYKWAAENGVQGGKFTSKINKASIFLPAAGCRRNDDFYYAGSIGGYESSTQDLDYSGGAYGCAFDLGSEYHDYDVSRFLGHSVRPVSK